MRPLVLQGRECVEILQLGKSKKSRRGDDIDAEDLGQAVMVEIEGILEGEKVVAVRMHDTSVLDHMDIFGRPSRRDVRHYGLLQKRPIASEADEEWSGFIDVGIGRIVP